MKRILKLTRIGPRMGSEGGAIISVTIGLGVIMVSILAITGLMSIILQERARAKLMTGADHLVSTLRVMVSSLDVLHYSGFADPYVTACLNLTQGQGAITSCPIAYAGSARLLHLKKEAGTDWIFQDPASPPTAPTPINPARVDDRGNVCTSTAATCRWRVTVSYAFLPAAIPIGGVATHVLLTYRVEHQPPGTAQIQFPLVREETVELPAQSFFQPIAQNTCKQGFFPVGVRSDGTVVCDSKSLAGSSCVGKFVAGFDPLTGEVVCVAP